MRDVDAIREMYRYNRWANDRVLLSASGLTPEDFIKNLGSSYPSVRNTLVHIVWGEWLWLERWLGSSPQSVFAPKDFPLAEDVRDRFSQVENRQRAFLESLTAERLDSLVRYSSLSGEPWEYPLWRQMIHAVNHSTYHRGQTATLLRQLGAPAAAPTDFLVFHDEIAAGIA